MNKTKSVSDVKVPEGDVQPVDPQGAPAATTVVDEPPVSPQYTEEDLKRLVADDPDFRQLFMENEAQFITVQPDGKSEPEPQDPDAQEPAPQEPDLSVPPVPDEPPAPEIQEDPPQEEPPIAPQEPAEPVIPDPAAPSDGEEVTLTFEKDLLGTYVDVEAMSKGNSEKDKTIGFYKRERIPALETRVSDLQRQLAEAKKAPPPPAPAQPAPVAAQPQAPAAPVAPAEPPVEVPVLEKINLSETLDPDVFGEESVNKLQGYFDGIQAQNQALATQNTNLVAKTTGQDKVIADLQNNFTQVKTEVDTNKQNQTAGEQTLARQAMIDAELAEIDTVRRENPGVLGEYTRPTVEIETEYISFVKDIAQIAGVQGPLYASDGSGAFAPNVTATVNTYLNQTVQAGKDLKAKCDERGVSLPADYDSLDRIYDVRKIRNSYFAKDGTGADVPIPYSQAIRMYSGSPENANKVALEKRIGEHNARQQAAANRQAHAPTTPPEGGTPPQDPAGLELEYHRINATPMANWSDTDRDIMRKIYIQKGISAEEAEVLVFPKQQL